MNVADRDVLVLGAGVSGRAAADLVRALGGRPQVIESEDSLLSPPPERPFSLAIVSPGIPLSSPLVAFCRERKIPLESELQFGCEELMRRGWKLLAVTGSKGKSSVVKLCAEALGGVACGNYGLPACAVALDENPRWAVVEVSSFMMETTELGCDTFEAAAILNLQEDHLDRHGSVETYHALKRRLLGFAKNRIEGDRLATAANRNLYAGGYFDNDILWPNAECAVSLLRAAGLGDARIAAAFASFEPLPHRMNLVAEIDGVRYIDDSKATSLAALAAGVRMAGKKVRLIAGGLAKGDDPKSVVPTLSENVTKAYLIGSCAESFAVVWNRAVDCEVVGTLENAVAAAKREAVSGETVLLSPGTASFDQFKNFNARGDAFAALCVQLDKPLSTTESVPISS